MSSKPRLMTCVDCTRGTCDAVWPAQFADGLITLHIIDQILDIDLHRWTPVRGRDMGWHQCTPSSNSTTLESNMGLIDNAIFQREKRRLSNACGGEMWRCHQQGEGVPPAAPTAPPAHHPSRAGPAAAVWRPALAAPGGRHCALVSGGRPRSVARGRQGGWAHSGGKGRSRAAVPPSRPSRAGCPASVLAVPCGAGRWPAGSRQGWPAAGVGASGHALARPAPGGQRGAGGPTPGVGTSGRRVAGGGRTRAGGTA